MNGANFPYAAILKKAYKLTRENVALWVFGVFLSLSSVLNVFLGNVIWGEGELSDFTLAGELDKFQDWIRSSWGLLTLVMILLILFLSAVSKAAVVWSVKNLDSGKPFTVSRALREGRRFIWPIFWMQTLLLFLFFLLLAALAVPVVFLAAAGEIGRAAALAFLGAAIFVPVTVLLVFLILYGPVFVVLYQLRLRPALSLAFRLIQTKLLESLILAAFLAGICLGFMILVGFSIIVVSAPIAFLFLVFSKLGLVWAVSALIFITAFFGLCGIVILSAGLAIFNNCVWLLAVQEMVKTEKTEEQAKVLAPEAEPA